jgi:hypothetical protein
MLDNELGVVKTGAFPPQFAEDALKTRPITAQPCSERHGRRLPRRDNAAHDDIRPKISALRINR